MQCKDKQTDKMAVQEVIKFTKMHGLGNDYIYINCLEGAPRDPASLAVEMSDRHKGVGADGIILIMDSNVADFKMRMFNADGSEGKMCGNASRCIGKYVYEHGLTDKQILRLETLSGIKILSLDVKAGKVEAVTVDMGEPVIDSPLVPVISDRPSVINAPVDTSAGEVRINAVSMGNPTESYLSKTLPRWMYTPSAVSLNCTPCGLTGLTSSLHRLCQMTAYA